MTNLVVGMDGTTTSWRALSMALGMAARDGAQVHVSCVLHVPAMAEMGAFAMPIPPPLDDEDNSFERDVQNELVNAGVVGEFTYRKGDVAPQLEALAETCRADLIVVGRSRHPALHLGGVPRKLLAMGRRPVLVVP